ncbi:MAG TPA: PAS domain-containing protein, partial [Planctomycetota bacterium]|nr:PAS domain-containing protein [Planctomycetota bacterium]
LVEGRREVVARGEVAGCPIRTSSGRVIGAVWLRTPSPRTWTPDAIELIETSVELVRCELDARARRRPDAKVALILESISDACVFLDPSWRYTYMNRKAGEIFARDPALMVGKHIWTEFPEGVGQPFYHAYHRAMREQVPIQLEEYYPPYDRWFENRIYPSQEGLAIFFQDVTERKRAELAIERVAKRAERERELRAQAERLAHLGFWTWDILRNHITWSDELYRIYGLDRRVAEASFEAYLARLHPQDRDSVRSLIEDSLRDRTPMSFEERIVRPDGEVRWLHTWGNVALREDGEVSEMFGVCIDVTEMVETTEDLRRKEAWLEAALESSRVALWEWEVR